jgi:DNA-binding MarR family transcriptional regulator
MTGAEKLPDVGILAGQFMRAVQEELFELLAEQGHPQVRPRHGSVLATRAGLHKQIVGTIVDELVALGYVRREADPRDRRAKLIVPTDHGVDEISKARAILAAIEQRHERTLGTAAYTTFKQTFQQITRQQRAWRQATADEQR